MLICCNEVVNRLVSHWGIAYALIHILKWYYHTSRIISFSVIWEMWKTSFTCTVSGLGKSTQDPRQMRFSHTSPRIYCVVRLRWSSAKVTTMTNERSDIRNIPATTACDILKEWLISTSTFPVKVDSNSSRLDVKRSSERSTRILDASRVSDSRKAFSPIDLILTALNQWDTVCEDESWYSPLLREEMEVLTIVIDSLLDVGKIALRVFWSCLEGSLLTIGGNRVTHLCNH